jgi:hypothetical protein
MSDKHNDQKLIIENFNKWINEQEEKTDELDDLIVKNPSYVEEEIEEAEEIQEIVVTAATGYAISKFVSSLHKILGLYNEMRQISDDLLEDPNAPQEIKNAAANIAAGNSDIKDSVGSIADDIPIGQKLTQKAIEVLIKKHFGMDIDLSGISIPSLGKSKTSQEPEPKPEPEPELEPEDDIGRAKQGLLQKDKAERLAQLRAKYRSEK